jgi:hypothetical protein
MSSGDKRKDSVGNDRLGDDPRFGEAREAGSKPASKGFMFISPSVAGAGLASKADTCCVVLVGSPVSQYGVLLWRWPEMVFRDDEGNPMTFQGRS